MKILFTLAIILTASVSAQTTQTRKTTKKMADTVNTTATPAARQAVPDAVIPKGAVEGADGTFHFTDAQGKKWTYRNTPFGVSKAEDKSTGVAAAPAPQPDTLTTATDAGDSVNFSKPSPFGTVKWTKKKTEMDANETSVWNSQKKQ